MLLMRYQKEWDIKDRLRKQFILYQNTETLFHNVKREEIMRKHEILQRMLDDRLVGIIRTDTAEEAVMAAEACIRGGMKCLEVTFTVPGAAAVIKQLSQKYKGTEVLIGAGTVLDAETTRSALLNGAEFIVSPTFNLEVAKMCNRYSKLYTPGVMTLNEIMTAMEAGVDLVKIFPASAMGPKYLKAVKAPLPQTLLMPTGGVSLENAAEWLANGADALGIGGQLTKGVKEGDYNAVEDTARKFCEIVKR